MEYDDYGSHIRVTVIDQHMEYTSYRELRSKLYTMFDKLSGLPHVTKGLVNISSHISPDILKWENHLLDGAMFYDLDIMVVHKGNGQEVNCILEEEIGSHRIIYSYSESNTRYVDKAKATFAHYDDVEKLLIDIIAEYVKKVSIDKGISLIQNIEPKYSNPTGSA